jgi:hypothetical protein
VILDGEIETVGIAGSIGVVRFFDARVGIELVHPEKNTIVMRRTKKRIITFFRMSEPDIFGID